jgi:hypothetical protein
LLHLDVPLASSCTVGTKEPESPKARQWRVVLGGSGSNIWSFEEKNVSDDALEVDMVGPGALSADVHAIIVDALIDLELPATIGRTAKERGPGGWSDSVNPLEIYLAAPAGIVFTKLLQSTADDAYRRLKSWTEGIFAKLRRESGTDHVAVSMRNLTLFGDNLPDEAYEQLLDILRGNPDLSAHLTWDVPRDEEGRPYVGAPARWLFDRVG